MTLQRAIAAVALLWLVGSAAGDELVLKTGGRLRGKILQSSSASGYVLQLASGGRVRVAKPTVVRVIRPSAASGEYQRRESTTPDTPLAHWLMSEWCRKHSLSDLRKRHLKRAVSLDPDHIKARHALGYSHIGGRWQKENEFRREAGYVKYQGRWRLKQEIALMQQRDQREQLENAWKGRIKRLRAALVSPKTTSQRHQAARARLSSINDPLAARALSEYLGKETIRRIKFLYIASLAQIKKTGPAIESLVNASMNDPDEEVFHECLDHLKKLRTPALITAYIKYLKHQHNGRVNRAGIALQQLEDNEAISPLIDSLVTTHYYVHRPRGGSSPDAITTSFVNPNSSRACNPLKSPHSDSGITAGNRTKIIPMQSQNSDVLSALVSLSDGVNFGYNQVAWRNWYSAYVRRSAGKSLRSAN